LWNGIVKTSPEYLEWVNVLEQQKKMGAKIIIAKAGQQIFAGKVLINVLGPANSLEGQIIKNTSNDTAVVSKIVYGEKSFLFTADIDVAGERKIIKAGLPLLANVLKIAHHGSKYSTSDDILKAVKPEIAIIEVGKNSYGHPTPEVLQKLINFGIKTLRTDQNGDITILTNGNNLIIK
jgi:beta-lactamase superfamily II metal-dependent hydrolase